MTDIAAGEGAQSDGRQASLRRFALSDAAFRNTTRAAALLVLLSLAGVAVSLVNGSLLAFSTFGFEFLVSESWNPVKEKFGALAPIYGTVASGSASPSS